MSLIDRYLARAKCRLEAALPGVAVSFKRSVIDGRELATWVFDGKLARGFLVLVDATVHADYSARLGADPYATLLDRVADTIVSRVRYSEAGVLEWLDVNDLFWKSV